MKDHFTEESVTDLFVKKAEAKAVKATTENDLPKDAAKEEAGSATFTNAPMADQLRGFQAAVPAVSKKRTVKSATKKSAGADLSGLTLRVEVGDDAVDVEKLRQEAKERSEKLFGSAADYYKMCFEIEKLRKIDKIELTSYADRFSDLVVEKDRFDAYLAEQPQGVQDQFYVDLMIVEIDSTTPVKDSDVIAVFKRIEETGRGKKSSFEELAVIPKEQRLYFIADNGEKHDLVHVLSKMPGKEGQVSGADKRIFNSTRQLIWRYVELKKKQDDGLRQEEITKCEKIRQESGEDPRNFLRKIPGMYVFYLPGKKINGKPVGMPGAAKVQIYTFVKGDETKTGLRILEGAGCLVPRWPKHEKYGWNLPMWWLEYYIEHRQKSESKNGGDSQAEFPDSIPEEIGASVRSFIKKLYAAYIQAKKNVWKLEIVSNPPVSADLPDTENRIAASATMPESELVKTDA